MADLRLRIYIDAITKAVAPLRSTAEAVTQLRQTTSRASQEVARLQGVASDVAGLERTRNKIVATHQALDTARQRLAQLQAAADTGGNAAGIVKAQAAVRRLETSLDASRHAADAAATSITSGGRASAAEMQRLRTALSDNAIAQTTLRQRITQMDAALRQGGQGSQELRQQLQAARQQMRLLESTSTSLTTQQADLQRTIDRTGMSVNNLSHTQDNLRQHAALARAEMDAQTHALERARQQAERTALAQERLQQARGVGSNVSGKGVAAVAGGAAAVYGASAALSPAVEFGKTMSAVQALTGLDKQSDDMKKLSQQAIGLGAVTSFSATESAEGQKELAQAGFEVQQVLAALPGVMDGAAASGTPLAEMAKISSNTLHAFNMEAEESGRVSDVLTAASNASNASVQDLGETMKYVAPVAASVNASVEDAASMAAALSNVGIAGSEAGTAMRAMYLRMANPPKGAAEELMNLHIKMRDAKGNLLPMVDILTQINDKIKKMGTAKKLQVAGDIAGAEAAAAFIKLLEQAGDGNLQKINTAMQQSQGIAKRTARTMTDNLGGDLDAMFGAAESLSIALANINDDNLRGLITTVGDAINAITQWTQANPGLASALSVAAAAIAGLSLAGGALAIMIGGLIGPFVMARYAITMLGITSGAGAGMTGLLSGAIGVLRASLTALIAHPALLVFAALAAAAIYIYANWSTIGPMLANIWQGALGWMTGMWDQIKSALSTGWEAIKALFFAWHPLGLLIANWDPIIGWMSNLWDRVKSTLSAGWEAIKALFFAWHPLGLLIANWDPIVSWMAGLWDRVTGIVDAAIAAIAAKMQAVRDLIDGVSQATAWVADSAKAAGHIVSDQIARVVSVGPQDAVNAGDTHNRQQTINDSRTTNIVVNAAPGQSETGIAQEVVRQQAAVPSNRGALYDPL